MPNYIEMPKLSDTMTEGTLLKWRKKVGDKVEVGDIIAEVETDKATMEMEAFDDGTIGEIYIQEGAKVPIGSKMAVLVAEGEKLPAKDEAPKQAPAATAQKVVEKTDAPKAAVATKPAQAAAPAANGERVKASPLAKKIAAEKGVDLSHITGSGPGGRIVRADVLAAKSAPAAASAPAAFAPIPLPPGEHKRIALSGMRRVIAERLVQSKTTIPHFYLNIDVDAGELMKLRAEIRQNSPSTISCSKLLSSPRRRFRKSTLLSTAMLSSSSKASTSLSPWRSTTASSRPSCATRKKNRSAKSATP
jgi:pyruvate dehydrogenase E2 component (dihydrolipoamide acetyltransferase)